MASIEIKTWNDSEIVSDMTRTDGAGQYVNKQMARIEWSASWNVRTRWPNGNMHNLRAYTRVTARKQSCNSPSIDAEIKRRRRQWPCAAAGAMDLTRRR